MIFFDTTKTGGRSRRSGLDRVSSRLRDTLGADARAVVWGDGLRAAENGEPIVFRAGDAFLTSELFSEPERPGFMAFLASRPGPLAAIFHDAIPLRHPHITWPQSVARHPEYMKLLSRFDRVWAVSDTSRADLLGFWRWQGVVSPPPVEVLALGADFDAAPRVAGPATVAGQAGSQPPQLLCLGILEPRKNQAFLLEVCAELWAERLVFELHVIGRVNPHFGADIVAQVKRLRRLWPQFLHFHEAAADATVARLFATVRATVFPTIAEGCGLPLLESLWRGVPCVCSDLPVLRENASGGGCLPVAPNDRAAWKAALRRILTDTTYQAELAAAARTRPLPTWRETAGTLTRALSSGPASPEDSMTANRESAN